MSAISRRTFIGSASAVAAAGASVAAASLARSEEPDAELIEMGRRYDALHLDATILNDHVWELSRELERRAAAIRPETLRATDRDRDFFGHIAGDPRVEHWFNNQEVASLAMVFGRLSHKARARADEITEAWKGWFFGEERERISDEIGLTDADDRLDRLYSELDPLGERIMATPARTAKGLAVKARLVLAHPVGELATAMQDEKAADLPEEYLARFLKAVFETAGGENV